ncbi:MAG TPA: hypothetical protein VFC21_08500 [Bryobacteraceae bacterium]|nr:hypothetical protein [Bryobacteraceae bacterium]
MAFGNIGKALAGQAFETTKKGVMDAFAAEPAKPAEPKPAAPEALGGILLGQVQGMQRALREDQELVVQFHTGTEMLRVTEIFVPSLQVFVLAGTDAEQNVTRVIVPAEAMKLVCRIVKVAPDARPVRVNVLSPRPKPEPAA